MSTPVQNAQIVLEHILSVADKYGGNELEQATFVATATVGACARMIAHGRPQEACALVVLADDHCTLVAQRAIAERPALQVELDAFNAEHGLKMVVLP